MLRYAAAATVLLSEYKVDDHRADSGRARWAWARRVLSPSFGKARADLKSFDFPLDECDAILGRQTALEQRSNLLDVWKDFDQDVRTRAFNGQDLSPPRNTTDSWSQVVDIELKHIRVILFSC